MTSLAEIITTKNLITDKNSFHSYCDYFYENEFARYRDKPIQLVEIGFDQGGSLILWAEWFKQAKILGIDLQLRGNCEQDCARYPEIQLALGNAYDLYSLHHFPSADIIIDDGSHHPDHQVWAVKHLSTRVKPGGIFVIEDVLEDSTIELLKAATPFHLKDYIEVIDLRSVKGRIDDLMFVIRVPDQTGTNISDSKNNLVGNSDFSKNLSGLGADMMIERISHLKNIIDFNEIKNIIDVGSAHGYESLNLARIFQNAHIFGFEPTPEHYDHCLKLKKDSGEIGNRMAFMKAALNDVDGPIKFYPLDLTQSRGNNTGMASKFKLIDPSVFPHELSIQKEITVDAIRLDTWCNLNGIFPEIIWMDAQGSEYSILKGAEKCLSTSVQVILTEVGLTPYYHGHELKSDIDSYLFGLGFKELVSARKLGHQYEMDTIYIKG
jgi:FkbM family methyltransferase